MPSDDRAGAIAERLETILGESLTEPPKRLSSGASRETWAFATDGHGRLIAQLDADGASYGARPPQAPLLEAAAEAGVPVARVVASGDEDAALGHSWVVLEALTGTTDPNQIITGDGVPAPAAVIDSIAKALAAVHRMPADTQLAPAVEDQLVLVRQMHESVGLPHPVFEMAFRELERTRPDDGGALRRSFVHGDFRIGNLMVGPHGVTGVLDWELAHIGNRVADLGWLCVPAWRFNRPDRPAGGLGTREHLLEAYARHADIEIAPDELRWWELLGTLRWGVMCGLQAFTHLSGARRSLEHAVIGRRACEVEWDLLEMLDPDGGAASPPTDADPPSDLGSLHDRPTALELLAATRGALGDDVLPHVTGRAGFQVRVAMRAVRTVERQLENAAAHDQLHADTLAALGADTDAALAAAIRAGDHDGREAELLTTLREVIRAKLEVANPRYLKETP
jgi:YD repeat-containing protein